MSLMLMKVSPADRKLMRDINLNQVLNLIRFHAPVSRTKLAELSGLSSSTVFGLTYEKLSDSGQLYQHFLIVAIGRGLGRGA